MKYAVCAHYDGTTILLAVFESSHEAENFMLNPASITFYEDETYTIYPDEMWMEPYEYEEIPFAEPIRKEELVFITQDSDLPF